MTNGSWGTCRIMRANTMAAVGLPRPPKPSGSSCVGKGEELVDDVDPGSEGTISGITATRALRTYEFREERRPKGRRLQPVRLCPGYLGHAQELATGNAEGTRAVLAVGLGFKHHDKRRYYPPLVQEIGLEECKNDIAPATQLCKLRHIDNFQCRQQGCQYGHGAQCTNSLSYASDITRAAFPAITRRTMPLLSCSSGH